MKLRIFAALAAALMLTASCGVLPTGTGSGTANVNTSGSNVGSALIGLYSQYKADGKLDLTNVNNILNVATVVNTLKNVKTASSNFQSTDFISGLINGSRQLVNQNNTTRVVSNLATLAGLDLSQITNAAKTASSAGAAAAQSAVEKINTTTSQVNTAISAFNNIFQAFK